jgi:glycosyltransferase involved in cell wall biosynthesis
MKIAAFDPVGNLGGGSRVVRALLPAIKRNLFGSNITYFGNLTAINRAGIISEFKESDIAIEELISTRLSQKGLWGIYKSDIAFRLMQKKIGGLKSMLPLYFNGDTIKEIKRKSQGFDLALFPWVFLVAYPELKIPTVAIFHDFNYKYYFGGKSTFSAGQLQQLEKEMPIWIRNSIPIVSSEFMKQEIVKFYPECIDKVNHIYLGPMSGVSNFSKDEAREIMSHFSINKRYLLYPTNICSHKNIGPLLSAMFLIRKSGNRIKLVLTGPGTENINGNACNIGITFNNKPDKDVIGLGYVSNIEMDALVQCATVVVTTSLYEAGNGPGFDAWCKGIPVAMSNIPSFTEHLKIQGVKAALFNPRDPESIAECIIAILKKYKKALKNATESKKAIEKYSWDKAALEYIDVFKKAIKDNNQ